MKLLRLGALLLLTAAPASAVEVVIPLNINGPLATGIVALPGALGIDLEIGFENVVGLNPTALQVTARIPSLFDPALPKLTLLGVSLPVGLPVVLRIEPTGSSALSFQGIATVSLHTHNLALNSLLPLSFFSASGNGPFRDVTGSEGVGSYRVGGSTGGFSEFVIVLDLRPINGVITGKFNRVTTLLNTYAGSMEPETLDALEARIANARALYNAGSLAAASTEVAAFAEDVRTHSGADIPDVWRANDSQVNVAGQLRSAALTLKFSINRKSSGLLQ
jgi:hypothetical protein